MKYLISALFTILLCDFSFAVCFVTKPEKPLIDTFEVISVIHEEIACHSDSPEKLKLEGCILLLSEVSNKKDALKNIRAYGNVELCGFKPKEKIEMWVGRQCCDQVVPIECKEYPEGIFNKRSDGEIACMLETPYYIFQYKILKEGKTIIRRYNSEKRQFEDSDEKEFKKISTKKRFKKSSK